MEPNDGASARAHELRASLGARRQVEVLLAEASAVRQAAAADADAIVEEAQSLSDELLQESRTEADRRTTEAHELAEAALSRARAEADDLTRQARAGADATRARAEAEVEDYRRRVRAEVAEEVRRELEEANRLERVRQHEQQQSTIGDLEASVRILGVSLETATTNVGEMLAALGELHTHTADSLGHLQPTPAAVPDPLTDPQDPSAREESAREQSAREQSARDDLFRVTAPGTSVPSHRPVFEVSEERHRDEGLDADQPRSATEAFLLSAHVDHGDPPLPPLDDTEIGARYARDAMRATARSRSRQDDDPLAVQPGRHEVEDPEELAELAERAEGRPDSQAELRGESGDPDRDTAGKPLGWLFRSS